MHNFAYVRATDPLHAVSVLRREAGARLIAGGTDLLNLMKDGIEHPDPIVDISRLPLTGIERRPEGLRIGALARMSDVAADPGTRQGYPAITQALELSASPQLRTMATMGGNLVQRTRCPYFRADQDLPCNKRRPGSGCAALDRGHPATALFGAGRHCAATHPSDLAVALTALDATVTVLGPTGERVVALERLHRLPGQRPHRDTVLEHHEMITRIDIPASLLAPMSCFIKVRERASYAFALVSVAAAVVTDGPVIRAAALALGGVAPRPWRLRVAENALMGVRLEPAAMRAAIEPALAEARAHAGNAYKIELIKRAVLRALNAAGRQEAP